MAVVTFSLLLNIFVGLLPIFYLLYWFFTRNYGYWDKRGIPNIKKDAMIGSLFGTESQSEIALKLYNNFPNEKYAGCFQMRKPVLIVRDPNLIHKILVKDFVHFQDRPNVEQAKHDPLTFSLFNLKGHVWRGLRYKLTPTFTTGKLRGMFDQLSNSGNRMLERIEELTKDNQEVDSKGFLFEFTLDVIASCAFGLEFKSDEFENFKNVVRSMFKTTYKTFIRFFLMFTSPKLAKYLKVRTFSEGVTKYFMNLTNANIKYRTDNKIQRNDYFQLLLTLKEQEDSGKTIVLSSSDTTEDDEVIDQMRYAEQNGEDSGVNTKVMTEETICGNSFIFLIAGSEATANTITFSLLLLAQYPDIQQRLQQEIDSVLKKRGSWSYDAIKEMAYLDQVAQETQRMYPIVPMLQRECVLPYEVPDSDLVIEKGVIVDIPVMGLQRDPQYYPEPDRFNPDRFVDNNFKPSPTFLPFGDGPRVCIAMRFAVMEVKTCLAKIMSQYTVTLSPKTTVPIEFDRSTLIVAVKGGTWLKFHKR